MARADGGHKMEPPKVHMMKQPMKHMMAMPAVPPAGKKMHRGGKKKH